MAQGTDTGGYFMFEPVWPSKPKLVCPEGFSGKDDWQVSTTQCVVNEEGRTVLISALLAFNIVLLCRCLYVVYIIVGSEPQRQILRQLKIRKFQLVLCLQIIVMCIATIIYFALLLVGVCPYMRTGANVLTGLILASLAATMDCEVYIFLDPLPFEMLIQNVPKTMLTLVLTVPKTVTWAMLFNYASSIIVCLLPLASIDNLLYNACMTVILLLYTANLMICTIIGIAIARALLQSIDQSIEKTSNLNDRSSLKTLQHKVKRLYHAVLLLGPQGCIFVPLIAFVPVLRMRMWIFFDSIIFFGTTWSIFVTFIFKFKPQKHNTDAFNQLNAPDPSDVEQRSWYNVDSSPPVEHASELKKEFHKNINAAAIQSKTHMLSSGVDLPGDFGMPNLMEKSKT